LFKKRYSSQESRLEDVHSKKEIEGLGLVYDYIRNDEWKSMSNIFVILRLNSILFSQTPYPEAGGKFRDSDCYLLGSGINTCPYKDIIVEINKLNPAFVELLNYGIELGLNNDSSNEDNLIDYINRCIELKCKIVKIHPFNDGNGRTARALVNLLFKTAGLPPIYIKLSEREKYLEAMNKAINEEDYNPINKFYYYKICDSILELDIANRTKGSSEELNNPLKKVRKPETKKN
jgi:fido (protein-threonine AMPylation protein)